MGAVLNHYAVVLGGHVHAVITSVRPYKYAVVYANGGVSWHSSREQGLDALDRDERMRYGTARLVQTIETSQPLTPGERYPRTGLLQTTPRMDPDVLLQAFTPEELQQWLEETWNRS